jgi:LmbE family N-acetylglucosaminyl deacetylase
VIAVSGDLRRHDTTARASRACSLRPVPSLLFVGAHPDDDMFGVSGSVALHSDDPDFRFVVGYATDGEAGEIAPDSGVSREHLGRVRRREAVESWDAIGRQPDRYVWFELPDGGLIDHPFEDLVARIASIITEERPDVVATMGPDGVTGHPDHVTVSAATTEAFHRSRAEGSGPSRLLYRAIPQWWIDEWNRQRREVGLWEWDPTQPFHLRGVPNDSIGVEVDTSATVERALAGIRAHKTQWSYTTMDDDRALAESLRLEHWVIAWPIGAGPRILTDIFEDITTG